MSLSGLTFSSMIISPSCVGGATTRAGFYYTICIGCKSQLERASRAAGAGPARSKPIGRAGHDPSGIAHQRRNRRRQLCRTRGARDLAVAGLFAAHELDDFAAALIGRRQPIQMTCEVTLDLRLGLGHEPQTDGIAERGREAPQTEGAE